jgi:uncharacterized protein
MRDGMMTLDDIRARISRIAAQHDGVAAVYLFGSRAEGRVTPLSDLDIAVLLDPREKHSFVNLRYALYADFCRILGTNDVDLTLLNTMDNLIITEEIIRNGILVYDGYPELRHDFELKFLHQAIDFKQQRLHVMGV